MASKLESDGYSVGRHVGAIGDVHGHLQLALSVMAELQRLRNARLDAVFLCGDLGSFADVSDLDNATRRHARHNPIELEFLTQWASAPPAPWLEYLFRPVDEEGLGLTCPVVFVHGNHEGFPTLARLIPARPRADVTVDELPAIDRLGRIRYLPSGWILRLASGLRVAGIGGIDPDQRVARYHPLAYLDEEAIECVRAEGGGIDLLITHQGPACLQGSGGSPRLDRLALEGVAGVWCHGHSVHRDELCRIGPADRMQVVPLHDVAFPISGPAAGQIRCQGWAWITFDSAEPAVVREAPDWLRTFDRRRWYTMRDGRLVCPPLRRIAWRLDHE